MKKYTLLKTYSTNPGKKLSTKYWKISLHYYKNDWTILDDVFFKQSNKKKERKKPGLIDLFWSSESVPHDLGKAIHRVLITPTCNWQSPDNQTYVFKLWKKAAVPRSRPHGRKGITVMITAYRHTVLDTALATLVVKKKCIFPDSLASGWWQLLGKWLLKPRSLISL